MKKNEHAAALGRMTSDKKAASSRENGKRGGRPKAAVTIARLRQCAAVFGCTVEDDRDNTTLYVHAPDGKGWDGGTLTTLVHPYGSEGSYLPAWRMEAIEDAFDRLAEYADTYEDVTDESLLIATGIQTVKPRHIAEEWDEGEDGYWIRLKAGWKWAGDMVEAVHCIHEPTKTKARAESVAPCDCRDCNLMAGRD